MEQWYALHTKPNSEYQVATVLQERGIETYLPQIEAPKARQHRKTRPFFPCYLFVKANFKQIGLSQVQWTPGLRRIVTIDEKPVPVPDQMIDLIRRRLGELETVGGISFGHDFQPGDTVRITDGPFQDMLAIFEGPATPAQRVQVLLNILGASRVQVDVVDLEKVSSLYPTLKPETVAPKRPRRTRGRGRRIRNHHLN